MKVRIVALLASLAFMIARADAQPARIPALPGLDVYTLPQIPGSAVRPASIRFANQLAAEGEDREWAPGIAATIRSVILEQGYLTSDHIKGLDCRITLCGVVLAVPSGDTSFKSSIADQLRDRLRYDEGATASVQPMPTPGFVVIYMRFDRLLDDAL